MDVVFAVMPFADAGRPSMGVSLLAAETAAAGFSTEVLYFNLDLAGELGLAAYQRIATGYPPSLLIGEAVFADELFGDAIPDAASYFTDIVAPVVGPDAELAQTLLTARRVGPAHLDAWAAEIMSRRPRVVGFTTVFHQTCACLALARRLKRECDSPIVVFGGANCEGDMGLQILQSFPWVDYVCSGESDISFLQLLERLLRGAAAVPIRGVLEQGVAEAPAKSFAITNLDELPYPDFDGYFGRLARSKLAGQFEGHLVFETSRGCWWGAKHHCTFCGLNGDTMVFRSKRPERAFREIEYLISRYGARRLGCVDNILDIRYVKTLFPLLADAGYPLEIFYEVKANLRLDQLRAMRAGGISQIQPGIESFSDAVLRLMQKGCTGFQNVQLMRWCRELGIEVSWNILGGFPEEDPAEYEAMAGLIQRLTHLDPPCSCGSIRLDRFSPFHDDCQRFGFVRVRPARAYFYVFPLTRRELGRIAYFFDYDYADGRNPQDYMGPVQREAQRWIELQALGAEQAPHLDASFDDTGVTIHDTRPSAVDNQHRLEGLRAQVYARCDSAATIQALARDLEVHDSVAEDIVAELDAQRLIARSDDRVLSLAVFRQRSPAFESHSFSKRYAADLEATPA